MDAAREVSIKVFESDATYGHSGGAGANQVTKSGTNRIHGTLSEFHQDSGLNAHSTSHDCKILILLSILSFESSGADERWYNYRHSMKRGIVPSRIEDRPVSLNTLAACLSLSPATVSLVVSNAPGAKSIPPTPVTAF